MDAISCSVNVDGVMTLLRGGGDTLIPIKSVETFCTRRGGGDTITSCVHPLKCPSHLHLSYRKISKLLDPLISYCCSLSLCLEP